MADTGTLHTPSLRKRSSLASMSSISNMNQYKNLVPIANAVRQGLKSSSLSTWAKIQEAEESDSSRKISLAHVKSTRDLFQSFLKIETEEVEASANQSLEFPFMIFNPRRRSRLLWDVGIMGLAFLSIFTVLLRLSFETTQVRYRDSEGAWAFFNSPQMMAMEYTVDLFFFMNFFLTFRTAYFIRLPNGSHNLVTDPRLIALRFLRTWFILDLVASIPWELFANAAKMAQGRNPLQEMPNPVLTCLRIPRILHLLRIGSVFALTSIEGMDRDVLLVRRMLTIHSGLVRVLKLLVVLVLNIHVWSCIVFYIGTLYDVYFHGESWLINTRVQRPVIQKICCEWRNEGVAQDCWRTVAAERDQSRVPDSILPISSRMTTIGSRHTHSPWLRGAFVQIVISSVDWNGVPYSALMNVLSAPMSSQAHPPPQPG